MPRNHNPDKIRRLIEIGGSREEFYKGSLEKNQRGERVSGEGEVKQIGFISLEISFCR
jgi:hypothetical protein